MAIWNSLAMRLGVELRTDGKRGFGEGIDGRRCATVAPLLSIALLS